jgi:hypothetical protein
LSGSEMRSALFWFTPRFRTSARKPRFSAPGGSGFLRTWRASRGCEWRPVPVIGQKHSSHRHWESAVIAVPAESETPIARPT